MLCTIVKFARRAQTHDLRAACKVLNLMIEKDREGKLDRAFEMKKYRVIEKDGRDLKPL